MGMNLDVFNINKNHTLSTLGGKYESSTME